MSVRTLGAAIVWCVLAAMAGCPSPALPVPIIEPVFHDDVTGAVLPSTSP